MHIRFVNGFHGHEARESLQRGIGIWKSRCANGRSIGGVVGKMSLAVHLWWAAEGYESNTSGPVLSNQVDEEYGLWVKDE